MPTLIFALIVCQHLELLLTFLNNIYGQQIVLSRHTVCHPFPKTVLYINKNVMDVSHLKIKHQPLVIPWLYMRPQINIAQIIFDILYYPYRERIECW